MVFLTNVPDTKPFLAEKVLGYAEECTIFARCAAIIH